MSHLARRKLGFKVAPMLGSERSAVAPDMLGLLFLSQHNPGARQSESDDCHHASSNAHKSRTRDPISPPGCGRRAGWKGMRGPGQQIGHCEKPFCNMSGRIVAAYGSRCTRVIGSRSTHQVRRKMSTLMHNRRRICRKMPPLDQGPPGRPSCMRAMIHASSVPCKFAWG